MDLKVEVTNASLGDVVEVVVDEFGEQLSAVTLGDAIVRQLLGQLKRDARWDALADRFWDAVDKYMRKQAPAAVQALVAAEVTRQLESAAQGAVTRGQPSTRAEAMISTEVTAQLRGQFAPLVDAALQKLSADLDSLRLDALVAFKRGAGQAR